MMDRKFRGSVLNGLWDCLDDVVFGDCIRATDYTSDKLVETVTRKRYKGKEKNIDLVIKIGRPNYVERKFIKNYLKIGGKFPTHTNKPGAIKMFKKMSK